MPNVLGKGSSTLPTLQWECLSRASVPEPSVVPLGSCNMRPLLPGRTGSLGKKKPNTDGKGLGRLLQNIFFFKNKGHSCHPARGSSFTSDAGPRCRDSPQDKHCAA